MATLGSLRLDRLSMVHPFHATSGRSWGPFEGRYRNASVLHDVAYGDKKRPWQDCDRMFYFAMRCSGVSAVEAKTMFYALYKFGHHWKFPIKRAKPVKYDGKLVARGEEIPRAIPVNPE